MQNFGQISPFLWAKLWTYGQNRGQKYWGIPIHRERNFKCNCFVVGAILMSPTECCWALTKSYPDCL